MSATMNEAKKYVAEAIKVLVDEEASLIPVAGLYTIYISSDRVEGLTPHPAEVSTRWNKAYIAK